MFVPCQPRRINRFLWTAVNTVQSDVDEVGSNRYVILSMNADIIIGRTCEKLGCVKENKIKMERDAKIYKKKNTSICK